MATKTHAQNKMPCEDRNTQGEGACGNESQIGGRWPQPRHAWVEQALERQETILFWSLQRGCGPAITLILDFRPQNCEAINSCCFRPLDVVTSYGSQSKLILTFSEVLSPLPEESGYFGRSVQCGMLALGRACPSVLADTSTKPAPQRTPKTCSWVSGVPSPQTPAVSERLRQ